MIFENNKQADDFQKVKDDFINKIVAEEGRKNSWLSFVFIGFCMLVYGYIANFTPDFYSKEDYLSYLKNFAVSKDSANYLSSFILSNYTHFNMWHIVPNCFFFFAISKNLGGLFNWKKLAFLTVLATFTTSIFSYFHIRIFAENPDTLVIGFSGVVFAVFGVLFTYMPSKEKISNFIFIMAFHLIFIVGNNFYESLPNIAWYAHLYGFLTGYIVASIFGREEITNNLIQAHKKAVKAFNYDDDFENISFDSDFSKD